MMNNIRLLVLFVGVALAAPVATAQILNENFDSLAVGTNMQSVEGWEGWYGDESVAGHVTDEQAHSGNHSLRFTKPVDSAPFWTSPTSGKWVLSTMQYVPSAATTESAWYGVLYSYTEGTPDSAGWITEVISVFDTGEVFISRGDTERVPLVRDAWVEIRSEFDFDSGVATFYYNDELLGTRNATSLEGLDLWAASNDVMYFDDFWLGTAETYPEFVLNRVRDPRITGDPNPADRATDVPRDDVVLSWTPGIFASPINGHKVYFSENFNDVNDGIGGITQDANSYALPQRLDFNTTYYWRVDEVNAPPDSTIFKGEVWSFTTEPIAYPIAGENITATAFSSFATDQGPEKTINGSGLDANDLHSAEDTDMWLSAPDAEGPAWIQYEFDRVLKLHEMLVWNHNSLMESGLGLGCKDATIEYSVDGNAFTTLGTTHEFTRAPGAAGYAADTTIDFGGAAAKYVKLTINSNWGEGLMQQYGLSEVRFFSIPVHAREPNPIPGTTDVSVEATLDWRAGRDADKHIVYLSTDEQAVIDGTADAVTVTESSLTSSIDLASTYYWRIDEVNEAETPTTWPGDLWHFATLECLVVDDIENYNYLDPKDPESNRIYTVWTDGYGILTNGSQLGRPENPNRPPFTERTIVHGGRKAMSLIYDNSTADFSEVTTNVADLQAGQDWSRYGIQTLSLWFYGDPCNVAQQMYVKLNGSKVLYDSDADNITRIGWQPWNIKLADFGVDLSNVTELSIGFERFGAVGGSGVVYFDDIRQASFALQLVTPAEPNTADLVAYYTLDGNANDSAGGNHGTAKGNPQWVTGYINGAIDLDRYQDEIECGNVNVTATGSVSIAFWAKPRNVALDWAGIVSKWGDTDHTFWLGQHGTDGWLRFGLYLSGGIAETPLDTRVVVLLNDRWSHIVCTYDGHYQKIYAGGVLVTSSKDIDAPMTNYEGTLRLGNVPGGLFFDGLIDDVRIYERALTDAEVAWLSGRRQPFDKPF